MPTRSLRSARTLHVVLTVAVILLIDTLRPCWAAPAAERKVERLLLQFHNRYLPGADFGAKIKYPRSDAYYFAWSKLIVCVGSDAAFIVTAGHSEVGVKLIHTADKAGVALDSVETLAALAEGEGGKAARKFAVSRGLDGMVWATEQYVGSEVPGLRTAIAVHAVFDAREQDERRALESVMAHKELQAFAGDVARAAAAIKTAIEQVDSAPARARYDQMLAALLQKRAELAVYRELARQAAVTGDPGKTFQTAVLRAVNPAAATNITIDQRASALVDQHLAGAVAEQAFLSRAREWVAGQVRMQRPAGTDTGREADRVMSNIGQTLKELARARAEINRYGGGTAGATPILSYPALSAAVPQNYRMLAALDVRELAAKPVSLPADRPATPGTTRMPEHARQQRPSLLPTQEEAGRFLEDAQIVLKATAILIDQKRLQKNYLRVRAENSVLLVDGFVQDRTAENLLRRKLETLRGVKRLVLSCRRIAGLGQKGEYDTHISQPAKDALLAGKIRTGLAAAQLKGNTSKGLYVAAADVFKERAKVYIISANESDRGRALDVLAEMGVRAELYFCPAAEE